MKVLVYGAGVIGSYLAHVLCRAKNEVYLLARGERKEQLEQNGLVIHHLLQKKTTADYPHIVCEANKMNYDVVFVVMQHQQMWNILDDIANTDAHMVVLIGNNLSAKDMERIISEKSNTEKRVLFGFQSTAGKIENTYLECVRMGGGELYIGGLNREATNDEKALIHRLFCGTRLRLNWQDNMDGWYKSHLAFILPVAYLCYSVNCNLKKCTKSQRKQLLDAANEGYGLLKKLNIPIRPEGEDSYYRNGIKRWLCVLIVLAMAKTKIGELCAAEHCRNAVSEMESLDKAWTELRLQASAFPMPNWDALRKAMPLWEELHKIYDKK